MAPKTGVCSASPANGSISTMPAMLASSPAAAAPAAAGRGQQAGQRQQREQAEPDRGRPSRPGRAPGRRPDTGRCPPRRRWPSPPRRRGWRTRAAARPRRGRTGAATRPRWRWWPARGSGSPTNGSTPKPPPRTPGAQRPGRVVRAGHRGREQSASPGPSCVTSLAARRWPDAPRRPGSRSPPVLRTDAWQAPERRMRTFSHFRPAPCGRPARRRQPRSRWSAGSSTRLAGDTGSGAGSPCGRVAAGGLRLGDAYLVVDLLGGGCRGLRRLRGLPLDLRSRGRPPPVRAGPRPSGSARRARRPCPPGPWSARPGRSRPCWRCRWRSAAAPAGTGRRAPSGSGSPGGWRRRPYGSPSPDPRPAGSGPAGHRRRAAPPTACHPRR